MAKNNISSVIGIDAAGQTVSFGRMNGDGLVSVYSEKINGKFSAYNDEYFRELASAIRSFRESNSGFDFQKTAIVLPNRLFFTDTFSVPLISKRAIGRSVDLAVNAIYKNADELNVHTYRLTQNKQYAVYGLVGVRRDLLSLVQNACKENNVDIFGITSNAASMVNGVLATDAKLRTATFLYLDIKESYANYAWVYKGQLVACYDLPFGYSILQRPYPTDVRSLFDHSSAERIVLNAKMRARKGQNAIGFEEGSANGKGRFFNADGDLSQNGEKLICKNFELFVKWTLELIAANTSVIPSGALDTVYVNIPSDYNFIFDSLNEKTNENKVAFVDHKAELTIGGASDDLGLLGGFYVGQYNKDNTF